MYDLMKREDTDWQGLNMGRVTEDLFMSVDSQIYAGQSKAHNLIRDFKDKRSIIAKRYEEATTQSKSEIVKGILGRAKHQGIKAD